MAVYFRLQGVAVRRHNYDCDWWVLAIDRRPLGHLASFCQEVPLAHRAGDCVSMQRDRVLALKVPETVASQFSDEADQTYVTEANLPAFLSYIYDYDYTDVDMTHVDLTGVWLAYSGPLDAARHVPRTDPRPKNNVPRKHVTSSTTAKPVVSRYARVRKNLTK